MTDLSGYWVPVYNYQANCTANNCDNGTRTMRTSFQLKTDAFFVEKVLVGTGNCTLTDDAYDDTLILAVEKNGILVVDFDQLWNESFPIGMSPAPGSQTNEPEPQPSSNVPSINPAPAINPSPAVNPSPDSLSPAELNPSPYIVNPAPQPEVNPSPNVNPSPDSLSPAELNPSPYIIIPVEPTPQPSTNPQPVTVPAPESIFLTGMGNYSIWLPVQLLPRNFYVTILDGDEDLPYTSEENGPCMPALSYWQDNTVGCPCNGTWLGDGSIYEQESAFLGGRLIEPLKCPAASCPEAYFINDTIRFGNLRMNVTMFDNGTIINKTIEITKMSPVKEIGYAYGANDIVYVYQLGSQSNNTVVQNPTPDVSPSSNSPNPAPYIVTPGSEPDTQTDTSAGSPLPLATTITMLFVFLLMMH